MFAKYAMKQPVNLKMLLYAGQMCAMQKHTLTAWAGCLEVCVCVHCVTLHCGDGGLRIVGVWWCSECLAECIEFHLCCVQEILTHRKEARTTKYLIKWLGSEFHVMPRVAAAAPIPLDCI